MPRIPFRVALLAAGLIGLPLSPSALSAAAASPGQPKPPGHGPVPSRTKSTATTATHFETGTMQSATTGSGGCGPNFAGEPAIHVSKVNNVFLTSELGLGGGTDAWRGLGQLGGTASASPCNLVFAGQPNAVGGVGLSGGDTDLAIADKPNAQGNYNLYVASLNVGSVAVATSTDNGNTFSNFPVQAGLPLDDREWIAASGAQSSLLSYHDIATNDIDVLRTDSGGAPWVQISQAIPESDYKAANNELGNLVIDHRTTAGTTTNSSGTAPFWAYQSFVAPSSNPGTFGSSPNNEAFLAISHDGGYTWNDVPVPCSANKASSRGLDHNFPNVSVAPDGSLWMAWSDDTNVYTAHSPAPVSNGGVPKWTCSHPVSTTTAHAIFPWIVATSAGVDLVFYGTPQRSGSSQTWSVEFAQDPTSTPSGWQSPTALVAVHKGSVCESGATCTSGRQLFDDFGIDTDRSGWAHIAYSEDADSSGNASLGGSGTVTGGAVQTAGAAVGAPN